MTFLHEAGSIRDQLGAAVRDTIRRWQWWHHSFFLTFFHRPFSGNPRESVVLGHTWTILDHLGRSCTRGIMSHGGGRPGVDEAMACFFAVWVSHGASWCLMVPWFHTTSNQTEVPEMFRIIENCLNSFEFYFVDLWYFVFLKKNRSRTSQLKYSDPEQVRQGISYRISSYFIQTWNNLETSERPGRRCRSLRSPSPGRSPWSLVQCHGARRTIPMTSPRRSGWMWGISPMRWICPLQCRYFFVFHVLLCQMETLTWRSWRSGHCYCIFFILFLNHADLENISFWLWCTDCFIEIR